MEETKPEVYLALSIITILGITLFLFLFIWKRESHPNTRIKFRTVFRQLWKIVFLLAMIIVLLFLIFDPPE